MSSQINELTSGVITTMQDFIKVSVYSEVMPADSQLASRWDENIDNIAWLVTRIGKFFFKYDRAYNSYKHGLRVMTGPHWVSMGRQNPNGTIAGSMHVIQAAEDSVMYLQKEPVRDVDGEKEVPISEVTKAFNPFEASFYLAKMNQMLETIKATRLAFLQRDGKPVERINLFFGLDRDEVEQLERFEESKLAPVRADEARAYSQFFAQTQFQDEQQINKDTEEQSNE